MYTIALLGLGGVGKSCIANRLAYNRYNPAEGMTIGVDCCPAYVRQYNIRLIDLSGLERFRFLLPGYINAFNTDGAFLVTDLTRVSTCRPHELDEFLNMTKVSGRKIPVLLLGNKSDYNSSDLRLSSADLEDYVDSNNLLGYEFVSAKTGFNVEKSLKKLLKNI